MNFFSGEGGGEGARTSDFFSTKNPNLKIKKSFYWGGVGWGGGKWRARVCDFFH